MIFLLCYRVLSEYYRVVLRAHSASQNVHLGELARLSVAASTTSLFIEFQDTYEQKWPSMNCSCLCMKKS